VESKANAVFDFIYFERFIKSSRRMKNNTKSLEVINDFGESKGKSNVSGIFGLIIHFLSFVASIDDVLHSCLKLILLFIMIF